MTAEPASPSPSRWATLLGLALALFSPFAFAFLPQPKDFAALLVRGTMLLGAVTMVVLFILKGVERQPFSSIGLRRPGWGVLGFGLLGLVACLIA